MKTAPLPEKEIRCFTQSKVELRANGDGERPTLVGYAAVFDTKTDLGWMVEQVRSGAFAQSLSDNDDIRALLDHDAGVAQVIGRRSAGTLRLEEDGKGLRVEIDLPKTRAAEDLLEQLDNGNVDGMSFGFIARKAEWDYEADPPVRSLVDVELIEVSVVTFPAYPDTSIAQRSLEEAKRNIDAAQSELAKQEHSHAGQDASEESRTEKPLPSLEVLRLKRARRK